VCIARRTVIIISAVEFSSSDSAKMCIVLLILENNCKFLCMLQTTSCTSRCGLLLESISEFTLIECCVCHNCVWFYVVSYVAVCSALHGMVIFICTHLPSEASIMGNGPGQSKILCGGCALPFHGPIWNLLTMTPGFGCGDFVNLCLIFILIFLHSCCSK